MPLKLIVGPANSAKAGVVLDAYRAAVARDPLLVVPTFGDVGHYRRELAEGELVFGGEVMRFGRLMREVAKRAGYRARSVGALQRRRLIARAISDANLTDALAESAAAPGFARAANRLIGELERALIEPPVFHTALKRWAAGDPGRLAYANEVAAIYTGYRAGLERLDRVDPDLYAWRALDALRADPNRWGDTPVFLYGFDDLTPLQRDAIETLARIAGAEVTVSLTHEPGRRAFASRARTVEDLRPLAGEVVELPPLTEHYADASRPLLSHLERTIFEEDADRVPVSPALRLLEAGGERAEAELAAAEVLELLRSGVPGDEIAVVVRSPRQRAPLIAQVFAAYDVPCSVEWSVPVGHTALGRGVLALLRCALGAGTADDVLAYLRTPGLLRVPALADRLEFEARRAGAVDVPAVAALWEGIAGWPLDVLERMRAAVEAGPARLYETLTREATSLFTHPYAGSARLLEPEELVDARVHRALRGSLAELTELAQADPDSTPSPVELEELLGDLPVFLGDPPRPGAVQVASPREIRARRYRAVLVLGLREGEFPARARPEPFLPDAVRREVIEASQLRLPPREDNLDEERYLFYACVSRPEETLILSRSTSDEEGTPTIPSFFLADVARVLDGAPELRRRPLAQITWPVAQAPTAAELERAAAAAAPRRRPEPIQPLTSPAVLEELASKPLSAGSLEQWIGCPVRWLVEKRLDPQRLEPDAVQLVRGALSHAALEETLRRLREETGSARVTEATLPLARELVAGAIQARRPEVMLSPHEPTARAELWRLEREICRYLAFEADLATEWEPVHLELRFGLEGAELPVLELGGGELQVWGVIDRVDVDPSGRFAVVRDYKSTQAYPVARWEPDGRLQVALYMLAVERLLDLKVVAGVYQPLRGKLKPRGMLLAADGIPSLPVDATFDKDRLAEPEFRAELDRVETLALEVARELRSGRLEPRPDTCHWRGDGCSHQGICRSIAA